MDIVGIFNKSEVEFEDLYNELIRVNKDIIPRWNVKTSLNKIEELQKIDNLYNAYFFKDSDLNKFIGFGILVNEDGENKNCNDIKLKYQINNKNCYWLANFFIYPEYRGKGYGNKCFSKLINLIETTNKDFYLYTDESNYANKIYLKYMNKISKHNYLNKTKIIYYKKGKIK